MKSNIVVVGDIMVDKYTYGSVSRISPEAPVPVVDSKFEVRALGGAANVVMNLHSLSFNPILCGVVGNDNYGSNLLFKLEEAGLCIDCVKIANDRPTTVKNRIVADNNQHIVRIDTEERKKINNVDEILSCLLSFNYDAVIISDYGKGVICDELVRSISPAPFLAIDPKDGNYRMYVGADLITPNRKEAVEFCGYSDVVDACKYIGNELYIKYVLITLGKDGMILYDTENNYYEYICSVAKNVFDVTGAGDTVISVMVAGVVNGDGDMFKIADIANRCAGVVVGEVGTTVIDKEVYEAIKKG